MIILIFITLPMGPITVAVFAAAIGLMWLSTVPPTSGLVVQIFGIHYMGMLYGLVYLSHQLGSFTGIWLGGLMFDATGNYGVIWRFAIGLGITSAVLHLLINYRPVERLAKTTS